MKHIGKTVKALIEEKGLKKAQFARDINLSHAESLSRLFKSETIQCDMLDRICRVLNVSPAYFFEEEGGQNPQATASASTIIGNANASAVAQTVDVATLQALLAEKERTIQILLDKIGTKTGQNE